MNRPRSLRRLVSLSALWTLTLPLAARACPTTPTPVADPEPETSAAPRIDHSAFDAILRATVRDEKVDYIAVRDEHFRALEGYLDMLQQTDLTKESRDEQLAAMINLYNATMIHTVVKRLHADYTPAEKEFTVFSEKQLVRMKGENISLNALENERIRPMFKEPRIHVALVCGAVSCPPLVPFAYTAANLEQTLETNMKKFVQDKTRNPIDTNRNKLVLSSIFDWYGEDFGGKSGVAKYVDRYHPASVGNYDVSFAEYSWALNIAAPKKGRLVAAKSPGGLTDKPNGRNVAKTRRKGVILQVISEKDGWLEVIVPYGKGKGWISKKDTTSYSIR